MTALEKIKVILEEETKILNDQIKKLKSEIEDKDFDIEELQDEIHDTSIVSSRNERDISELQDKLDNLNHPETLLDEFKMEIIDWLYENLTLEQLQKIKDETSRFSQVTS